MKANEAPEKIYLCPSELAGIDYDEEWYDRPFGDSVEYIRTDVFIDTLELKEVDLEKEIKNGIYNLSNLYCYMEDLYNGNEEEGVYPIPEKVKNELFEFAKNFFELGLKAKRK